MQFFSRKSCARQCWMVIDNNAIWIFGVSKNVNNFCAIITANNLCWFKHDASNLSQSLKAYLFKHFLPPDWTFLWWQKLKYNNIFSYFILKKRQDINFFCSKDFHESIPFLSRVSSIVNKIIWAKPLYFNSLQHY